MLFRGVIDDLNEYRTFTSIINALSKNGRDCVLNIKQDSLSFIVRHEDTNTKIPYIWCNMEKDAFFCNYHFTGTSPEFPEIFLLFNATAFAKALISIKQAFQTVKISLLSKSTPCLSVDVKIISTISTETKRIVHDVPVYVIMPNHWKAYAMPNLPSFYTVVEMPNIKHIIDKYKNLAPKMTFYVNTDSNEISLTIETDITTVMTNFSGLRVSHHSGNTSTSGEEPNPELSCQVETKSLATFLNSLQFNNTLQKSISIENDRALKFQVMIKNDVYFNGIVVNVSE